MNNTITEQFQNEVLANIKNLGEDKDVQALSRVWVREIARHRYSYNFSWLGRPIIQFPQDMVAMQELIWEIKPDLIIETGIAHGGSLIFSASMLAMLDFCEAMAAKAVINPVVSKRKVLGLDIDIRSHNRTAIEAHPMALYIQMIQGSSIDKDVIKQVKSIAGGYSKVLVCLDSNHTHEHVLEELNAYASLVSKGSYCVVFDTLVDDMPPELSQGRPWGPGNNPKTAVFEFLKTHPEFEIDKSIDYKLLISVAPDGFLKKTA
jgi:cephalosporin hydroxylase